MEQIESGRNAVTVKDKYPALDQLGFKLTVLDNRELGGIQRANDIDNAKFNGCLFRFKGQMMICYRAYSEKLEGRSNIFITLLHKLKPGRSIELELPVYEGDVRQYEDARLFQHDGYLYLSYVCVEYTQTWWASIHVVKLDRNFKVIAHYIPQFDGNHQNNPQKNWIFFSDRGKLVCIFDTRKHHILEMDSNFRLTGQTSSRHIVWDKGFMRGGTTPLKIGEDRWLAFFHSSVDHNQRRRRYSMTPYIFSRNRILSIGKTIFASTQNPIVDIRTYSVWWNPVVVFPMGLVDDGDDYLVSLGVNDLYNVIMHLPKAWVMDQIPAEEYHKFDTRYFFWDKSTQLERFSGYKILKVGGGGTQIVGSISDPEHYAFIKENYRGMEWITKRDYEDLMK